MSIILEILAFPFFLLGLSIDAMGFSTAAFANAAISTEARAAAVFIAFFAGVSEMLGQSVILVVNRVALYRFLASLLFTGLTYVLTALAWGLSALALAPLTHIGPLIGEDIPGVIGVLCLAFAPRLLGVFSMAPYFGRRFRQPSRSLGHGAGDFRAPCGPRFSVRRRCLLRRRGLDCLLRTSQFHRTRACKTAGPTARDDQRIAA